VCVCVCVRITCGVFVMVSVVHNQVISCVLIHKTGDGVDGNSSGRIVCPVLQFAQRD
jgi:hypothetical protein